MDALNCHLGVMPKPTGTNGVEPHHFKGWLGALSLCRYTCQRRGYPIPHNDASFHDHAKALHDRPDEAESLAHIDAMMAELKSQAWLPSHLYAAIYHQFHTAKSTIPDLSNAVPVPPES